MGTGRVGLQRAAALEELLECSLLAPGPATVLSVLHLWAPDSLTHPHRVSSSSSELLSGEQLRLSYDSASKGLGPDIRGTAPSNGQRRAALLSEVDPRDHLFPSLQKRKKRKKKGQGGGGHESYNMGGSVLLEVKRPKQSIHWSACRERRSLVNSSLGPQGKEYWCGNTEGRSQDSQGGGIE